MDDKFFKQTSAEIISDLLSDARVKRVRQYVQGEEFKADRERVRWYVTVNPNHTEHALAETFGDAATQRGA